MSHLNMRAMALIVPIAMLTQNKLGHYWEGVRLVGWGWMRSIRIYIMIGRLFILTGHPVCVSLCAKCENATLWLDEKIIYPTARMGPPANSDLPDNVKEIYEEASAIARLSTRAACALLRLAIEMLLKRSWAS